MNKKDVQTAIQSVLSRHLQNVCRKKFVNIGDVEAATKEVLDCVNPSAREPAFSTRILEGQEEENNIDDPHFDGKHYEKEIDQGRLTKTLENVFLFMILHGWVTDEEIAEGTGGYLPTVGRSRRYLKAAKWGAHTIEARRREVRGKKGGTWEYKLIPNKDSLTYKNFMKNRNKHMPNLVSETSAGTAIAY